MNHPAIVSRDAWLTARKAHLAREKELTLLRDRLCAERRELPWVEVEKAYVFDTPEGRKTLGDLFAGRSQLIVQHFMMAPGWGEGCIGCSFGADHVDAALVHLEHHDVSFVAVSRAPLAEILAYRKRMGWRFRWVSSHGGDFNYDYHVSFTKEQLEAGEAFYNFEPTQASMEELPGASVFYKDEAGRVFHTYSSYGRGGEEVLGTYMLLDLTPKGRNENGPHRNLMDWVRRHDEYEPAGEPKARPCHGAAGAA
jgi:predicted dithiol-disulfide oxidoreductase (DUF899 family)